MTQWRGDGLSDGGMLGGGRGSTGEEPPAACGSSLCLKGQVGSRERGGGGAFEGITDSIDGRTEKATDAVNGVTAVWSRSHERAAVTRDQGFVPS